MLNIFIVGISSALYQKMLSHITLDSDSKGNKLYTNCTLIKQSNISVQVHNYLDLYLVSYVLAGNQGNVYTPLLQVPMVTFAEQSSSAR